MSVILNPDIELQVAEYITDQFPRLSIGEIRFVGNGSCNVVFAALTADGEIVVRMVDRRLRAGEHIKEAWCIKMALACGVSGPGVLAVGARDNTSYMIQEFVDGVRGDAGSIDQQAVWRRLGQYARLIHAIDTSTYPEAEDSDRGWAARKWQRYVTYGIDSLTPDDRLIELGVYSLADQGEIRSIFERLQRQQFAFGLCHGDLSEWNTIVGPDGTVSLIDWGCASVGIVPHVDISSIFRWMREDDPHFTAFLNGYGMSRPEFDGILQQIYDYRLLESFDLVRWSIDRRPDELDDYTSRAKETWELYGRKS